MAEINTDLKSPGSAISTSGATNQWVNPSNALVEDGTYATMVVPSSVTPADNARLELSGFGFDLPAPAVITAISFAVKTAIYNGTSGGATMNVKARLPAGTESATTITSAALTSDDTSYTFGGTSELWGGTWTPADVNSASFGCYVRTNGVGSTGNVSYSGPSSATSEGGTVSWAGLTNLGAADDVRATVTPPGSSATTPSDAPWLNVYFTTFDPPIPSNAVITGIAFDVERSRQAGGGTGNIIDDSARIMKAGIRTGNDLPKPSNWNATTDAAFSYGGIGNLWGLTWTPTDIATTGFGFSLRAAAVASTGNRQAAVDGVQCRVIYTVPSDQSVRIDSVTASVTFSGITRLSCNWTETITSTVTLDRTRDVVTTVAEVDTVDLALDRARQIVVNLPEVETVVPALDRARQITGVVLETESVVPRLDRLREVAGGIAETEAVIAALDRNRGFTTSIAETESLVAALDRTRGLTMSVSETQSYGLIALERLRGIAASVVETEGVQAMLDRIRGVMTTINEVETHTITLSLVKGPPAQLFIHVNWKEWVYTGTAFQLQPMSDDLTVDITTTLEPSIMSLSAS